MQSVPMRLVIVKVAYGLQGHAHVYFARRMKCPRKDPPGRIAGYFHKTKVKQGKLADDTSFKLLQFRAIMCNGNIFWRIVTWE